MRTEVAPRTVAIVTHSIAKQRRESMVVVWTKEQLTNVERIDKFLLSMSACMLTQQIPKDTYLCVHAHV